MHGSTIAFGSVIGTVATVPFGTVTTLKNIVLTSVTTFSQNIYFQLWLVTISYFIILF